MLPELDTVSHSCQKDPCGPEQILGLLNSGNALCSCVLLLRNRQDLDVAFRGYPNIFEQGLDGHDTSLMWLSL